LVAARGPLFWLLYEKTRGSSLHCWFVVSPNNTWCSPTLVGCITKQHVVLPYIGWLLHQTTRGPPIPARRLDRSEEARASDDE
jgi:hypothetical protein